MVINTTYRTYRGMQKSEFWNVLTGQMPNEAADLFQFRYRDGLGVRDVAKQLKRTPEQIAELEVHLLRRWRQP